MIHHDRSTYENMNEYAYEDSLEKEYYETIPFHPRRNSHETAIIAIFHSIHSIIYDTHIQLSRERKQQKSSVTESTNNILPSSFSNSFEKRKKSYPYD